MLSRDAKAYGTDCSSKLTCLTNLTHDCAVASEFQGRTLPVTMREALQI